MTGGPKGVVFGPRNVNVGLTDRGVLDERISTTVGICLSCHPSRETQDDTDPPSGGAVAILHVNG